jgi:hypothetical protein
MNKDFTLHEQSLALKELGFDEPCIGLYFGTSIKEEAEFLLEFRSSQYSVAKGYVDGVLAPTFSQSFRWFREKYGLSSEIHLKMSNSKRKIWYNINELDNRLISSKFFKNYPKGFFNTYEEAELACLIKLIEIVKENLHS